MKSVMVHQFSQIPRVSIPRSTFNRSHAYKTTFDAGYLVPFYVDEALPGDTFRCNATLFARLATPIVPVMDNMFLDTFFFAVPIRLIWQNWQKFNGEQESPGDSTDYLVPEVGCPSGGWPSGSLADYFGIPIGVEVSVSALWFRAYNLVWNEWFRDQNLQEPVKVSTGDSTDLYTDYTLLRRGKRHDYFTSALPWPQKGPGVELPLGTSAPVWGSGHALGLHSGVHPGGLQSYSGTLKVNQYAANSVPGTVPGQDNIVNTGSVGVFEKADGIESGLYADLSSATAATINSLRQAFQLQRLMERDARAGSRYTEIIRSHFGVVSPDHRLQRPEYLGGRSTRITIAPVQQTSSTDATSPQGNLAAYGVAADSGHGFTRSFTEHCVIIGLVNVRADLTYQQGLNRMWSRRTRWDFYWPALAHLGEQAVLNKEIYAQGTSADNDVFGYQERWAEYRYYPSLITGQFRSTYETPLDVWHLSQKFNTLPTLSAQFIRDDPPVDRVIAVPSKPQFLLDTYVDLQCARPMPVYSVPGLIDHF
jgi:hypothetical protein